MNSESDAAQHALRIRIDSKAAVCIGEFSRQGKSRRLTPVQALDHDMFIKEELIPVGILEPATGRIFLAFGNSILTSDLIADVIEKWLQANQERLAAQGISELVINADKVPDCNSLWSQFLLRMSQLADKYALNIHLVFYPPYHSKNNPIEHSGGGLERSWNGFLLDAVETMLKRAGNFIWRGIKTQVDSALGTYKTGIMHLPKEKRRLKNAVAISRIKVGGCVHSISSKTVN